MVLRETECAPPIIGIHACTELDLIRRIDSVGHPPTFSTNNDIIAEYSDLFTGLGCMPGQHHIVVDPAVRPVVQPPHHVPLAIQPKLKRTLDELVSRGVIVKRDEPTEWVN